MFARMGMVLGKYWDSDRRKERANLLLMTRSKHDCWQLPAEAYQIMSVVDAVKKIPGEMAELGVATGASALMISTLAPERTLHLFDTFEGLPEPGAVDGKKFKAGQYGYPLETVRQCLAGRNVQFHKGLFPGTAAGLEDRKFAFVHLDVDLYEGTRAGLEWFYPRLNRGGILISHDFDTAPGVNRAFEEFFSDKPEPYFDFVGTQCGFVKL